MFLVRNRGLAVLFALLTALLLPRVLLQIAQPPAIAAQSATAADAAPVTLALDGSTAAPALGQARSH